jgi:Tol biopolymer transport system component
MHRRLATSVSLFLIILIFWPVYVTDHRVQAQTAPRCFAETNLCIEGRIREFWEQNGGLAVFGYPITPQIIENVEGTDRTVQWFERNRLELHPENARPYDVLLGRLSAERLLQLGRVWEAEPRAAGPEPGCLWFEETGHNVCDQAPGVGFQTYWEQNGLRDPQLNPYQQSLALFGLPLTEPQMETNSSGDTVMTQWFERARFEYHPDNPPDFQVLLGLLGSEVRTTMPVDNSENGGQMAFTSVRNNNQDVFLCTVAPDQRGCQGQVRLTNIPENDGQPVWSPDGSQVAFESDLDGDWEIYHINANGSAQTRLTENTAVDGAPSWAALPIGWRIAFHSNRDGDNFDIYLVDSEFPENITRLTQEPADERYPAIAFDGSRLAFTSYQPDGTANIYVSQLVIDGETITLGGLTNLTDGLAGESRKPVWSPDGSRLAFENVQGNNAEIYVVNADGTGGLQNLTAHPANDGHPSWSPDGSKIAFHSNRDNDFFRIYMMNSDGSNPALFISQDQTDTVHPAWLVTDPR